MWVDVERIVPRIHVGLPVQDFADGQRRERAADPLVRQIPHCQVLEMTVLKRDFKTILTFKQNDKFSELVLNFYYPGDQIVDVVVQISLGVNSVASLPVVFVSFEEQMSEGHEVFLFECDHHFITQTERHQLFWKTKKHRKQSIKQTFGERKHVSHETTTHLDCDDCNFQYLQHQFPGLSPSGSVLLTGVHEVILEPTPEIFHHRRLRKGAAPCGVSDHPPGLCGSGQQGFRLLHREQTAERSLQIRRFHNQQQEFSHSSHSDVYQTGSSTNSFSPSFYWFNLIPKIMQNY